MNLLRFLGVVSFWLGSLAASAGVMLTASVYDTPGLPGYQTFDLTASSATGYLNGFDFTKSGSGGVSGPLHQGAAPSDDPWAGYGADRLFGGLSGDVADSHWLVDSGDGLTVHSSQSESSLESAFVFSSSSGQRGTRRSLPFARIVTNDPSAVSLQGEFLVEQYWSDGGGAGTELFKVSTLLSDIGTGPAPVYTTFPERPLPAFMRPPAVETPVAGPIDPATSPFEPAPLPVEPTPPIEPVPESEPAPAPIDLPLPVHPAPSPVEPIEVTFPAGELTARPRPLPELVSIVDVSDWLAQIEVVSTPIVFEVTGAIDLEVVATDVVTGLWIEPVELVEPSEITLFEPLDLTFSAIRLNATPANLTADLSFTRSGAFTTFAAVPEPTAVALLATLALVWSARRC